MAVEWGGMVYDASTQTEAGVPVDVWRSWSESQQELYLQDYFRTDAQKNYSTDLGIGTGLAYAYTGIVDHYTGLEAVEVGATTNQAYDTFKEASQDSYNTLVAAKNQTVGLAILLGLGYIATR